MKSVALMITAGLMAGCSFAPKYSRPATPVPSVHRGASSQPAVSERTIAQLKWDELLVDEQLQSLIRTALTENFDVRLVAARVLEARAIVGIQRSNQFPTVDAGASYNNLNLSRNSLAPPRASARSERDFTEMSAGFSWELDFWGRLRNATAAARSQLLAAEDAQAIVRQALVSDLSRAYFELLDLDVELGYTRKSLGLREESLKLVTSRVDRGVAAEIDLRQAEILVKTARLTLVTLERQLEQKENQVRILLGQNPGPVNRTKTLHDQSVTLNLPPDLPSEILERRPDVLRAERAVIGANFEIGVARAAYFPRIALTAQAGFESVALTKLLESSSGTWMFAPVGNIPVFNAGRLRSNVRAAEARKQAAVVAYQQTVQTAFRDAADSLIGYRKLREFTQEQISLVSSLQAASRVAYLRYSNGVTSYLEYLDTERQLLDGELRLAQARRDELISGVQVYRSLGGGWQ